MNEKIEGFFEVCRRRGLTGSQGVILPAANVQHLMLKEDVVEAAAHGLFHIYPVATVDEAAEILTGIPAGVRDETGRYAPDTWNGKISAALERDADRRRRFAAGRRDQGSSPMTDNRLLGVGPAEKREFSDSL